VKDLLDPLVEPFDDEPGDWADVVARAGHRRVPRKLLLAAMVALLALALAVPFGLAGRVIGLFKDEGKPVPLASLSPSDRGTLVLSMCSRVQLVARPGHAPEKRCADGPPRITEIANNGTRRYWKAVFPNGSQCLASGRVRGYRETGGGRSFIGTMVCSRNISRLIPTPKRPITVDAAIEMKLGARRAHLLRVTGLAGSGIGTVGLVEENGDVLKTDVKGRTYEFDAPPSRAWTAIAAYDDSGHEVYREPLTLRRTPVPRPSARPRPPPHPPQPPPLPKQSPIQRGEAPGASIDVYRNGLVVVHLEPASHAYKLLRPGPNADSRTNVSCARLAYGAGRWASLGAGITIPFRTEMRAAVGTVSPIQMRGETPRPPYDACWLKGTYGLHWNDPRGMHGAVEVPFTPLGRRYFDELAVSQDLALFMRTPQMRAVRAAMRDDRVPTGAQIASKFPTRVVGLNQRTDSAPTGSIGVWSNSRDLIVVSRTAEDGRRMYVTLRKGAFGPNNLAGLKEIYY
jgi:hypothetical protein